MEPRCPECGEKAVEEPPTTWNACWGPVPEWSHLDGEALCPIMGDNGYEPARQPVFI